METQKNAFDAILKLDPESEYAQRYLKLISEIEKP